MKKAIFLLWVLPLLPACRQDQKAPGDTGQAAEFANPEVLSGHWIALDFCSRVAQYGSVLAAMNNVNKPYAYSLSFLPTVPDSVECSNGRETWKLPVVYKKDTLELKAARQDKSVFLVYDSKGEKNITMFDNTQGSTRLDRFIKSKANAKTGFMAFATALNNNLFNGIFSPAGKNADSKIMFTPGGFLQGLPEYDRFEVCSAGDCFVAGNDIDIITLSNSKKENSTKMFGFRYNGKNDTLRIYNLLNPTPNEKGNQTVGSLAYTLARKKAD